MYYSTTQVCRCNEETRTNSNETSLIGQPLFDTETNTLYIGDGETKIKELQPITNLNAGIGMTINGGSVSLNEGTQTNAGGIRIWGDGKDIWYNENNSTSLIPVRRQPYNIPSYHYPNYSISGVATNRIDGEQQSAIREIHLQYDRWEGQITRTLTGQINCNQVVRNYGSNSSTFAFGVYFNHNNTQFNANFGLAPGDYNISSYDATMSPYGLSIGWSASAGTPSFGYSSGGAKVITIPVTVTPNLLSLDDPDGIYVTVNVTYYSNTNYRTGSDTWGGDILDQYIEILSIGTPTFSGSSTNGSAEIKTRDDPNDIVYIEATVYSAENAIVDYSLPITHTHPTYYIYKYDGSVFVAQDASNLSVSPNAPNGMEVELNGPINSSGYVNIIASYKNGSYYSSGIDGSVLLSYASPLYAYTGTNSSGVTGSYYRTTPTSSGTTVIDSGVSGGYAYATLATSEKGKTVSANVTTTYTTWSNGNNYYYSVNYNGSTRSCTNIEIDTINYRANSTKYNEYLEWARNNP